jgi:hypothetical protein
MPPTREILVPGTYGNGIESTSCWGGVIAPFPVEFEHSSLVRLQLEISGELWPQFGITFSLERNSSELSAAVSPGEPRAA